MRTSLFGPVGLRFFTIAITGCLIAINLIQSGPARADDSCADAAAYLDAARGEERSGKWPAAGRDGKTAATKFERCAHDQEGAGYVSTLFNEAGARTIVGLAMIQAGAARDNTEIRHAYALYRWVAKSLAATAIQRRLAAQKANAMLHVSNTLDKTLSFIDIPPPRQPASTPAPTSPPALASEALTPAPVATPAPVPAVLTVDLMTAWQTRGNNQSTGQTEVLEHVRVHLVAGRDVMISARGFRINVTTNGGLSETVYGYGAPSPTIQKVNYFNNTTPTTTVPTVDPIEDLGRQPIQLRAGDAAIKVVTFVIRPDAQFDSNAPNAIAWTGPR